MTGLTPIVIKAEEAAKLYSIKRESQVQGIDYEVQPKDWLHPTNTIRITEQHEQQEEHKYSEMAAKASTRWELV